MNETRYGLKELTAMMKEKTCVSPAGRATSCALVARGVVMGRVLMCELGVTNDRPARLIRTVEFPTGNGSETEVCEVITVL